MKDQKPIGTVLVTIEQGESGLLHAIGDFGLVSGESIEEICEAIPQVLAAIRKCETERDARHPASGDTK